MKPKRHHWWPMVQSRQWTNSAGFVFATRSGGTTIQVNPINIGVESELYTRFGKNDSKDTSIEDWFSTTIDNPANTMIEYLLDQSNVRRRPFRANQKDKILANELGFMIKDYVLFVIVPKEIRAAISSYVAALLVRHPSYLEKLTTYHANQFLSERRVRDKALANMLWLYDLYRQEIAKAVLMISRRVGQAEYLYADGGLIVDEPWRKAHGIPFDIHAPITPDIAVEVLPVPLKDDLGIARIMEATNKGVARQNRIILGGAQRFVFSRQTPPVSFIIRYFGIPAPRNIGYRIVNGSLETTYDRSRS